MRRCSLPLQLTVSYIVTVDLNLLVKVSLSAVYLDLKRIQYVCLFF